MAMNPVENQESVPPTIEVYKPGDRVDLEQVYNILRTKLPMFDWRAVSKIETNLNKDFFKDPRAVSILLKEKEKIVGVMLGRAPIGKSILIWEYSAVDLNIRAKDPFAFEKKIAFEKMRKLFESEARRKGFKKIRGSFRVETGLADLMKERGYKNEGNRPILIEGDSSFEDLELNLENNKK